jgi:hypothetical protein
MRPAFFLGTAMACITAVNAYNVRLSQAVQLQNGTVYFTEPPSLVGATNTFKEIYVPNVTYYFTINIPDNAGEPLQRVTLNEYQGVDDIRFDLKQTSAFEGDPSHKGQKLALKDVTSEVSRTPTTPGERLGQTRPGKRRTVSVTFDQPVPPGRAITIALLAEENPSVDGVYLYGVTAFPPGENAYGQFLGFGRLQFYSYGHGGI